MAQERGCTNKAIPRGMISYKYGISRKRMRLIVFSAFAFKVSVPLESPYNRLAVWHAVFLETTIVSLLTGEGRIDVCGEFILSN
jgi:hypothetical protein